MVYFPPAVTTKHVGQKLGCLALGVRRVWGSGARLTVFWCALQGPRLTVGFESIPFHPASIRLYTQPRISIQIFSKRYHVLINPHTAPLQFRWLAQPLPHGLFVGEILVFSLFRGKLTKHANHRMRQDAVHHNAVHHEEHLSQKSWQLSGASHDALKSFLCLPAL